MVAKFKAITPKPFKSEAIFKAYAGAVEKTNNEAEKLFKRTVKNFEDKPKFKKKTTSSSGKVTGTVDTDNEEYGYLSRGTKVRYARMTSDFKAKTQPGLIDSRQGSGGVLYIDTSRPLPGIEARRFEETIAKEMEPSFKKKGDEASVEGAKRSGHAI